MDSILIELDRLEEISEIIVREGLTSALEGAKVAIEWVLQLHRKGREHQVHEQRFRLSDKERLDIIGKQRYDELKEMRRLKEERANKTRDRFE